MSWMVRAALVAPLSCAFGCSRGEAPPEITAPEATQLALARYRALFSDKYLHNQTDGQYYPFPKLDVTAVTKVDVEPDAFVVHADPPAGVSLEARVAKTGRWTELVRVVFLPE